MRVKQLPVDTGTSGWDAVLPSNKPAKSLGTKITTDWLIIGGGFAGLAAARRLSQLQGGDKITLIDAGRIGQGPAGRNSGFMIDLPHDLSSDHYASNIARDKAEINFNRLAIEFARQSGEQADLGNDIFLSCGKINAASTKKGIAALQAYQRHLVKLNERFKVLDHNQLKKITGSNFYLSGLFTPGTCLIQPAAYVRGIAESLKDSIDLYENTPALSIEKDKVNVYRIKTTEGEIVSPKIILAVNGHVQSFGFFKQRLLHTFTYASMTRVLKTDEIKRLAGESSWNIIPADPMGTTVRRVSGSAYGGDRIVVRNRFTFEPTLQIDENRLNQVTKHHQHDFDKRFPMLKSISMEYKWGGRLCLSKNNVAAFGEVEENIFSAACQNGLGTTKGTLSGMLAAELATGNNSELLTQYQQQDTPEKLPPEPLLTLGVNSVLKFKQFRAGKEL